VIAPLSNLSRRELLALGGVTALGGLRLPAAVKPRARSCVFIFLFGGPSHIDLWDMKPNAPIEIRGDFKPIRTTVPGLHLCEHLPRLAQQAGKLCLMRSMRHSMPVHGPACSQVFSGRDYFGPPTTDQALPQDWPSLASFVMRFGKAAGPLAPSIVLPRYSQFDGQSKRIAGQTGGRMGESFNPLLVDGEPAEADFELGGLHRTSDVSDDRLRERRTLLSRLDDRQQELFDRQRRTAFAMLEQSRAARAISLRQEPGRVRERYGYTKFGQSLLLARRLVEEGCSLVTVNWDDPSRAEKVSPFWDTHNQNFPRLKDHLCPLFDRAFPTFLEDMHVRGLLDSTLIVALGEFGRTPKIGQFTQNNMTERTGRDHWPHAFTALVAGGGVRGGQMYGATSRDGGFVIDRPVSPGDLSATVLHHLGIDHRQRYFDEFQRMEQRLSEGSPIKDLS
jgi:hypothetical protein